jgi:hypothetical protein
VEEAQLVLSILTPVLVLALGIPIARYMKRLDREAARDERLIERRLKLFDEIGPDLNDLYCLTQFVGRFRSVDPQGALELKRSLDETIHVNRPVFSNEVMLAYNRFMTTVFEMYTGPGQNAKLRIDRRTLARERGGDWPPEWDDFFVEPDKAPSRADVKAAYTVLVDALAFDFGGGRRA